MIRFLVPDVWIEDEDGGTWSSGEARVGLGGFSLMIDESRVLSKDGDDGVGVTKVTVLGVR